MCFCALGRKLPLSFTKLPSEIWLKVTVNYSNGQLTSGSIHKRSDARVGTNESCGEIEKEKEQEPSAESKLPFNLLASFVVKSVMWCIYNGFYARLPPTFWHNAYRKHALQIPPNPHNYAFNLFIGIDTINFDFQSCIFYCFWFCIWSAFRLPSRRSLNWFRISYS